MIDPEFPAAMQLIRESRAAWLVSLAARRGATSVHESRARAVVTRVARQFKGLPIAGRIRSVALLVAVAALAHAVWLEWIPPRSAPAFPRSFWVVIGIAALGVVSAAPSFVSAWRQRT